MRLESTKKIYAGFWIRYIAFGIDTYIFGLIGALVLFLIIYILIPFLFHCDFVTFGEKYGKFWLDVIVQLIGFGTMFAYYVFMHGRYGRTIGKMILRLRVITTDYTPVNYKIAMIRWLGFLFSCVLLGIGCLLAAFDSKKQALHDKIAKTYVIRVSGKKGWKEMERFT